MDENIKLKLLSGLPLICDACKIYPLKLIEIAELGYDQYNYYLNILLVEPEQLNIPQIEIDSKDITTFDIINEYLNYGTDEYKNFLREAFSLFIREDVSLYNGMIYVGDVGEGRIINKDNYDKFKKLLKDQNCISSNKQEEEFIPANSRAEEIRQKIMKGRSRSSKNTKINLSDLISILASDEVSGLNILSIWELTMFQFNVQFKQCQVVHDYFVGIQSLLAGAKQEDVKLKHYIRAIEDEK